MVVVFMSGILEFLGVNYFIFLMVWIFMIFLVCMFMVFIIGFIDLKLDSDLYYLERLKVGKILFFKIKEEKETLKSVKLLLWIFIGGVVVIVFYVSVIFKNIVFVSLVVLGRDYVIVFFMLSVVILIMFFCKINVNEIVYLSVFKFGM